MRYLPAAIWRIVVQLNELRLSDSIFGRSQREESIVRLLKELEIINDPGTMPCVARFLFSPRQNIHKVAIEVIGNLIANVAPHDLIKYSDHVSWSYDWDAAKEWERLKADDVCKIAGNSSDAGYSGVLGILSFHRNGYVRHEAVRYLSAIMDGSELPFLIVRQNDWVQPVANDAQQAVSQRIQEGYVHHFMRCLRLTLHSESLSRYDHRNTLRRVIDLLCFPKNNHLLRTAILSGDRRVRHRLIKHVFEIPGEHQLQVLTYAIHSSDPVVREICCKHLDIIGDTNLFSEMQESLLRAPFMPVRREAFEQKAKRFPDQAEQIWKNALFDSSRSIRELARFMLKTFDIDQLKIASMYRTALLEEPESFPALEGLTEVGDVSDIEFFEGRLKHQLPSRRAAAIRGLARIDKKACIDQLVAHLSEESPCVVRAVRKAIGSETYLIDPLKLESLAVDAPSFFSRKNAIDLIFGFGKWQSIPRLLSVASIAEPATAEYAERKILYWFQPPECNRVFTRPTQQNKADIAASIAKAAGRLSDETCSLIQREVAMFNS